MGRRIRVLEAGVVYSAVVRCVDRQFLLRPDHDPRRPLLAEGCPAGALEPGSGIVPVPSVINVVGAAAARAQELAPVTLHAVEASVNHLHVVFSAADEEQVANVPAFFRNALSAIARRLNRRLDREGPLWAGPYRLTPCVDDRAAEQQLVYCVTNPVKDGLVETVGGSPFFTSFRALSRGEAQRYFRVDWEAYHLAGGPRKRGHSPGDYLEWLELELSPLPHMAGWPGHRRRSWMRAQVRDVERATREELRSVGRRASGARAQRAVDPRSRPSSPKRSGRQPLCHWSSVAARDSYRRIFREVVRAHRAASIDYRMGMWEREFPDGTFRPPLVTVYLSSRL